MADHPMAPESCRVAVKIDGLMLGWSSGVRLHVEPHALVLDSDVGRVTLASATIEHVERVRGFSSHGVAVVGEGSRRLIWEFHPGELEATLHAGGWTLADGHARFVGLRRSLTGGPTFTSDRTLVSS